MAIQSLEQLNASFPIEAKEYTAKVLDASGKPATFRLVPLSAVDRDAFESSVAGVDGKRNTINVRARLVAKCLVNDAGKRLVPEGHVAEFGNARADIVNELFDAVMDQNGMTPAVLEEVEKN